MVLYELRDCGTCIAVKVACAREVHDLKKIKVLGVWDLQGAGSWIIMNYMALAMAWGVKKVELGECA